MKVSYKNRDGTVFDFSKGNIRAEAVNGVSVKREIEYEENSLGDGGFYIGERASTRNIKLTLKVWGDYDEVRGTIADAFRENEEGIIRFEHNNGVVRQAGCRLVAVDDDIDSDTDTVIVELLNLTPYFDSESIKMFLLCGVVGWLEFVWELFEDDNILSEMVTSPSVLVINSGNKTGCVIGIDVKQSLTGLKVTRCDTGQYIKLKGEFKADDYIVIDSSSKSITLNDENAIYRMEWGSEFFNVPHGQCRFAIDSDNGKEGMQAYLSFAERFGRA